MQGPLGARPPPAVAASSSPGAPYFSTCCSSTLGEEGSLFHKQPKAVNKTLLPRSGSGVEVGQGALVELSYSS